MTDRKKTGKPQKLEPGCIFSIDMHNGQYAFGRCISKINTGHVVEIFDYVSSEPEFNLKITEKRMFDPIIIDSYRLFTTGKEGYWKIIDKIENYVPNNVDHVRFAYGEGPQRKVTDIWNNETIMSESEASKYEPLSPQGDFQVLKLISQRLKKN